MDVKAPELVENPQIMGRNPLHSSSLEDPQHSYWYFNLTQSSFGMCSQMVLILHS